MLNRRGQVRVETERITLRPPQHADFRRWASLRSESRNFLAPWEPSWSDDHLTRKAFADRVHWAQRSFANGSAAPFFLIRRDDDSLLGAITLENVRRGPSQSGTLGYWIGEPYQRRGYMREAIDALVHHAFQDLDLSRVEAACLPENDPSRKMLEKCGFKYEGVAQSYLQINGRWRNHVLYANLRSDRRGKTGIR